MSDQPVPTYLTADQAAATVFPANRGRYDIEPVDGFRIEAADALAELERRLDAETRRADRAEQTLEQLKEHGGGDPFEGAERLVGQQRQAQADIDRAVENAKRWAAAHTARARARGDQLVSNAERQARTLLEDARSTVASAAGGPVVPEPKTTGDQLADAVALAEYVQAARQAHDEHAVEVHARLDDRIVEAENALEAAQGRVTEARAALEAARRRPASR
jgi:cell division septum initiation protein DivIVA